MDGACDAQDERSLEGRSIGSLCSVFLLASLLRVGSQDVELFGLISR